MNTDIFSEELKSGINIAVEKNIPFAVYMFPNQKKVHFIASFDFAEKYENKCGGLGKDSSWQGVALDMFESLGKSPIGITASMGLNKFLKTINSVPSFPEPYIEPQGYSIKPVVYLSQLKKFTGRLRNPGSNLQKVVLSRMFTAAGNHITDAAQEYFRLLPHTFRYIYFTQETGLWMGASPEILIDYNFASDTITTMSLAGSRNVDNKEDWSEKNIQEHNVVTDYIVEKMRSIGLNPEVKELCTRKFGFVEHLCNIITAKANEVDVSELIHILSPTPALCGFPQKDAMNLILSTEIHQRFCYGGWVAVKDKYGVRAYVNLRCAHIRPGKSHYTYSMYTGGGIMPESEFMDEWIETADKISPLFQCACHPNREQLETLYSPTMFINQEFAWNKK